MVADATPVFIAAGVVFALLAVWVAYVAIKPGPKWAQDTPPPPAAKEERASDKT